MLAGRLHRDELAAVGAGPARVEDQAADPVRPILRPQPVEAERDLRAVRVAVVQRHRKLAALQVRRLVGPATVPADRSLRRTPGVAAASVDAPADKPAAATLLITDDKANCRTERTIAASVCSPRSVRPYARPRREARDARESLTRRA